MIGKRVATYALVTLIAGCGTTVRAVPVDTHRQIVPAVSGHRRALRPAPPAPLQALVTAQDEDRLLVVALPAGHVIRAVSIPGGPSYVDATRGVVVVVSSGSGTVTLLDRGSLRTIRVFRGFVSPHIPAISPDGRYAYVTDDGSGELSVIGLYNHRLISRVFVGSGAHHLAFSPSEREVWVALGQTARTITLLSTVNASGTVDPGRPHVVGHLHPGFLAHDLLFTPDGKQVWITSADGSSVGVFDARTRRPLWQVPAGVGPQHIVFAAGFAYITSGYGSSIEQVDLYSGRVLRRVYAPDGSFDLDAARHWVVTSSLLRGTLAIYDSRLRLLHVRQLASSTEDVTLSAPAFRGPGGAAPSSRVAVGSGITIQLPHRWQRVRGQLSDIVSPLARLAIASFPVRLSKHECECGFPNVVDFPRGGAFLFVWEYFDTSLNPFPPRPAHFRLTRDSAQRFECQGPSDSFDFRIGARTFEADVYLGAGTGTGVRHQLLAALDSFRAASQ